MWLKVSYWAWPVSSHHCFGTNELCTLDCKRPHGTHVTKRDTPEAMHEAATAIAGLSVSSGNTSKNDSLAPYGMPYVASGTGDGMVG